MARGYPSPKVRDEVPDLAGALPEGVCAICKRRPAETERGYCGPCAAALLG